jgi:hypothetical protein
VSVELKTVPYVYWRDGKFWLGYLEDFPEYLTQALKLSELEENLRDLHQDLTSGDIPCVRRRGRLQVA